MASSIKGRPHEEEVPEKEISETAPDTPLLDLTDAAVKKLIRSGKKRGYVTHDQINAVLPSEEATSEQIEDVLAMFSEMGVNVVEVEEPSEEGEQEEPEEAEEEPEGEIAIAKRIEAGREAMIAGLCESPLTFQAIIIWRDELNEGKVFLREVIDLEATYAGPDAKAMPAPALGPDGQPIVAALGQGAPAAIAATAAPPAAPTGATPFKAAA